MPKFTISILALNNLALTKRCITSVLRNSEDFELILTDNGSTDGVSQFFDEVAREHANVTVIHNQTNLGYQEPNRLALEMAKGEFLVLLNNDCEVPAGWLAELAKPFDQFPTACISGPRDCASALAPSFHGGRSKTAFEYIEFSTACLKIEIFRKHGLWIPGIRFAYADDSSTCLRMRELGYTLHLVPTKVMHHGGATSRFVPEARKIQEENHAFCRKRFAHYLRFRKMDFPIIIKRTAAHGDVLLTTPIIRALREKHPLSPIYVQTGSPQIFRGNPNVKEVLSRPASMPDALLYNLDGAYESKVNQHIVLAYAERCGLSAIDDRTDLFLSEQDERRAERLMPDGEWVVVHPGPSTWKSKEWPRERFIRLVDWLRGTGRKVALVGSAGHPMAADLDERGKTTFHEAAALIKRAKLFIGLDSLPLHLAQSVGTPVLGIFGITDPKYILTSSSPWRAVCGTTPSFGLRHRVVNQTHMDDGAAAINSITVEMVINAASEILSPKEVVA